MHGDNSSTNNQLVDAYIIRLITVLVLCCCCNKGFIILVSVVVVVVMVNGWNRLFCKKERDLMGQQKTRQKINGKQPDASAILAIYNKSSTSIPPVRQYNIMSVSFCFSKNDSSLPQ